MRLLPDRSAGRRERPARPARPAVVLRRERITPSMVRVVLGGPGLADFPGAEHADAYVKLVIPRPGVELPRPLDLQEFRRTRPTEDLPTVRTYTIRAWDAGRQELTIDFVVHGTDGIAGPWAAAAEPGDEVFLQGPGGGYQPDAAAGWHLLAGDDSALPAIAVALERMPADAVGRAVVEVPDAATEYPLRALPGLPVQWVHRGDAPAGSRLTAAVLDVPFPPNTDVQAFVHGEAGFVKEVRRWLRVEQRVDPARLSISGYWRIGDADEAWRAGKAAWNAEAEEVERQAGVA
ncbi:siderophore-interacting protein [Nakamurella leprariae]|uniref:Siderophore-interacting protein n=1 Tax=Nakamurella leprariae TaxID=2803911 RepID=A0A938YH71_9ACTN|nr:siderophore-interacting protein [Nakamurella leprariae]MBM9468059.1 siderophore-interacting protein [Nakamurella leprariae]